MKSWQQKILLISIAPIIWGVLAELRQGQIASFAARVIFSTFIGFFLLYIYERINAALKSLSS